MRFLGILACTIIGGTILNSAMAAIALFALDALDVSPDMNGPVLLLLFLAGYVFAAWAGSRLIGKAAPASESAAKTTFRAASIGIAIAAIFLVIAGIYYLEYKAESSAKTFCDAALLGTPIEKVAAAARGKGTDMLRNIKPESVTVGYTGVPPYSRHICEVEAVDGKVTKARYLYLD